MTHQENLDIINVVVARFVAHEIDHDEMNREVDEYLQRKEEITSGSSPKQPNYSAFPNSSISPRG